MSTNSNFKKDKCWSCEFYCGKREYKHGLFLGDSVYTDSRGTCSNKRSDKNGREVNEDGWCSRYQKWGVLQSALAVEAQKRESERIEAEQRREMQRIQAENDRREREMERERIRLEEERKRLEYERWYASLSSEERAKEDARIAEEKRREAERLEEARRKAEAERIENEKRRAEAERLRKVRNKKIKKGLIIGGISLAAIIAIIIASVSISNAVKAKKAEETFQNSDTGKLIALIQKETNGKNEFYFSVNRDEGCTANFGFEYKKSGWVDEYNRTRDFRVYCQLTARSEDHYKDTIGFCFFNLDGTENEQGKYTNGKNACYNSYATYGSSSHVFTQYQMVSYSNTSNSLSYGGTYYFYDNWNNTYNEYLNEWVERGFKACDLVNILINQYCVTAFGTSFWK